MCCLLILTSFQFLSQRKLAESDHVTLVSNAKLDCQQFTTTDESDRFCVPFKRLLPFDVGFADHNLRRRGSEKQREPCHFPNRFPLIQKYRKISISEIKNSSKILIKNYESL